MLVVILQVNALFGRGIAQLLRSISGLNVICLPRDDKQAGARLRRLKPDVIILEAPREGVNWELLASLPPATVIRLSLEDGFMDVYADFRVVKASPKNLLDAVHSGLRSRPGGLAGFTARATRETETQVKADRREALIEPPRPDE